MASIFRDNFSEESNIEYRTRNNECRRIRERLILKTPVTAHERQ